MAEMAVADGIATIIATPHQLGNHAKNSGETIRAATAEFQRLLEQRHVPLRVLPGADVRIEPDLVRKIRSGEVLTLGDRRRHVLLELPHDIYVPLDRLLDELADCRRGRHLVPSRTQSRTAQPARRAPPPGRARLPAASDGGKSDGHIRIAGPEVRQFAGRTGTRPFRRHRRPCRQDAPSRSRRGVCASGRFGGRERRDRAVLQESEDGGRWGQLFRRDAESRQRPGWTNWFCQTFASEHVGRRTDKMNTRLHFRSF